MHPAVMLTMLFIAYFMRKWVFPLSATFAMDEHALDLKNSLAPIPWMQIEKVFYKAGKYRNVIGIKLKEVNDYRHQKLPFKNLLQLRVNKMLYDCEFCIPVVAVKDGSSQLFESINDFFIRIRLTNAGWVAQ